MNTVIAPDRLDLASHPVLESPPLTLKAIVRSLPKHLFLKDSRTAWLQVLLSVAAVVVGYAGLVFAPWYLLPLLWAFTGTALTGWFVIGHDCGHRSFANRKWVNNWLGHFMFLPLLYPFHSWRIGHNHHHRYTNHLTEDSAWAPFTPEFYEQLPPVLQKGYQLLRGKLWFLASIVHWFQLHFAWWTFKPEEQKCVRRSVLLVLVTAAIVFPLLFATVGVWGWVKFWLMPWLGYHFWMSTFTLVHHTDVNIPFTPASEWNEAESQLFGTVHCEYPAWVEWLCHHINVHVPHHISTAIPSYKLREAYGLIKAQWGDRCQEREFSWELMNRITDHCHLYHPENYYQSFQDYHNGLSA
ncbi:MAG: fatty acid desaturase [Prochlorotrichaceae cyanobacterium]